MGDTVAQTLIFLHMMMYPPEDRLCCYKARPQAGMSRAFWLTADTLWGHPWVCSG